ncbi:hypothetical protein [Gemmatimonas sp.]|uniref:alpha/beta hydrolase family protein n=1 Tax=Gemmatimonas sp. TaxID=1962908 RepID=UPI00286EAABC|nr:hypothetical protein [Gemmatimonas sp.]
MPRPLGISHLFSAIMRRWKSERVRVLLRSTLATALVAGACVAPLKLAHDDSDVVLARQLLAAPNPSQKGSFAVKSLYYGSGTDKQRAVYRDSVTLKTAVVNGAKFASAPDPKQAQIRKKYWGFDFTKLPVNGRVWYPDAPGVFPLVLVVHGNHDMKQFSDPGYQYLGELLASRGYIVASVDENFLNGIRGENDARGWMLLKHLQAWKGFNDSTGSPLNGKVDMHNIALMGHSRGGEAVTVAGAFNRLAYYPDDATVKFDFNFDIKSLVAIAPTDGQYRPADKPTPVANYNYFLMHGSHDGDLSTFVGLPQYERIRFTDGKPWFKSAVFVYRANHGQWNTTWGSLDGGPRSARSLDTRGFLSQADQRKFAEVYISAFLDATLRGKSEYLPMFRDHRVVGQWLPKTMYTTRFQESRFRTAADFEEDVDVTSGSVRGIALSSDSVAVWKESPVPFRARGSTQAHNAVTIGWNNRVAGDDTTKFGKPASFAMQVSDSLRSAWNVGASSSLVFSLSPTDAKPGPRAAARDTTKKADSLSKSAAKKPVPKKPATKDVKPDTVAVDLSIEVTDATGRSASLPLSAYGVVRRPLETYVYRRAGRDKQRFANVYEIVLQTYAIPLADFTRATPGFDPARIAHVRWRFDRSVAGTIILDNIGFSNMRPEFTAQTIGAAR